MWAKPTNTFHLCNLMIAKQFAVLRLEHNGVSLEKQKQQEKKIIILEDIMGAAHTRKPLKRLDLNFLIISLKQEIILSHILQIVKTQIYFSINAKRADSCESAQLFKKVL